jgi:hypothetical protein
LQTLRRLWIARRKELGHDPETNLVVFADGNQRLAVVEE